MTDFRRERGRVTWGGQEETREAKAEVGGKQETETEEGGKDYPMRC